jgi:transcriptional regulator with XRE-family HTH domain
MLAGVPTTDRLYDRGTRLGERRMREIGAEFRAKRMELGLSQRTVARAVRISRSTYSRIEGGKAATLGVMVAARIGSVLGLDVVVRSYPGGESLRDAGSAKRVTLICENVSAPLRWKTEMPLPKRGDFPEQRRWDLLLMGGGKRTGLEFETRLYDAQAQRGRWNLKVRDDPVDSFVLVIADTRRNREVLKSYEALFADLPRIGPATFLRILRAGEHPPTGLVLLSSVHTEHHRDKASPVDPQPSPDSGKSAPGRAQD